MQKNLELLNLTNRHSVDCLTWAVNECSRNLLLDFGASPATLNKLNNNILHFPLREQRFRIAALFLSDIIRRYDRAMAQSLLRGQNDNGETPIHFWVHRDPQNNEAMDARDVTDEALLQILLGEELLYASVVNVADEHGRTPLHIIVATNQLFLAEILYRSYVLGQPPR